MGSATRTPSGRVARVRWSTGGAGVDSHRGRVDQEVRGVPGGSASRRRARPRRRAGEGRGRGGPGRRVRFTTATSAAPASASASTTARAAPPAPSTTHAAAGRVEVGVGPAATPRSRPRRCCGRRAGRPGGPRSSPRPRAVGRGLSWSTSAGHVGLVRHRDREAPRARGRAWRRAPPAARPAGTSNATKTQSSPARGERGVVEGRRRASGGWGRR